jgi:hypothetical protein
MRLTQPRVRGLLEAKASPLRQALSHNLMRRPTMNFETAVA